MTDNLRTRPEGAPKEVDVIRDYIECGGNVGKSDCLAALGCLEARLQQAEQDLGAIRDRRAQAEEQFAGEAEARGRLASLRADIDQAEKIILKRGQEIDRQMRRAEAAEARLADAQEALRAADLAVRRAKACVIIEHSPTYTDTANRMAAARAQEWREALAEYEALSGLSPVADSKDFGDAQSASCAGDE